MAYLAADFFSHYGIEIMARHISIAKIRAAHKHLGDCLKEWDEQPDLDGEDTESGAPLNKKASPKAAAGLDAPPEFPGKPKNPTADAALTRSMDSIIPGLNRRSTAI